MCISFGNPSEPCCGGGGSDLPGEISRRMQAEPIDDYASLSTASWQRDVIEGVDSLYYHFVSPDTLNVSSWAILQPVRWSMAAPAANGGVYDAWQVSGDSAQYPSGPYAYIRRGLIPSAWNCEFKKNIASIRVGDLRPEEVGESSFGTRQFLSSVLESIAPDVPIWGSPPPYNLAPGLAESYVYAVQVRANGIARGPLHVDVGQSGLASILSIDHRANPDDFIELDVWYRVGIEAGIAYAAAPGKGACTVPLMLASNGSRRNTLQPLGFTNVNFAPAFNPYKQTYELRIGGHTGWTLKNGTNGPHRMRMTAHSPDDPFGDRFRAEFFGEMTLDVASPYVSSIDFNMRNEIMEVIITAGSTLAEGLPGSLLYRSTDGASAYRNIVTSTDYGEIEDRSCGRMNQEGTTVFRLVPWGLPAIKDTQPTDIPSKVPRIITLRRVSR